MDTEAKVEAELEKYEQQSHKLEVLAAELQQDPKFAEFLERQKAFKELEEVVWSNIETTMIENNIRSIKTDKITLTIAERTNWLVDDELPRRFKKLVPNTKKISDYYKLNGKVPHGATPAPKKYLVKRVK